MTRYAQIVGWGMAVPDRVLTNEQLSEIVDTSDEWIRSRTGIRQRHVVSRPSETTASLATSAGRAALEVAQILPRQVDAIIVATVTPDHPFPATACLVQDRMGATRASAFDLNAGCSGFVYALGVASGLIASSQANHVLVIGAETLSRITNWSDRDTCVLFGDGAGAVLLAPASDPGGVLATVMGSDGSGGDLLILPAGGSRLPASRETVNDGQHFIHMEGRAVFRFATRAMPEAAKQVADRAGWSMDQVSLLIPHQANQRIIDASARRLRLRADQVFSNLEHYGNTSAASIPIALCEAVEQGRVRDGDRLILVGFGAGLTWAAAAIEWGVQVPRKPQPWWKRLILQLYRPLARVRSLLRRLLRALLALPVLSLGDSGRLVWLRELAKPPQSSDEESSVS
jgi:3-oxoacyl-[acyl-carrier-protein] synthase-3